MISLSLLLYTFIEERMNEIEGNFITKEELDYEQEDCCEEGGWKWVR